MIVSNGGGDVQHSVTGCIGGEISVACSQTLSWHLGAAANALCQQISRVAAVLADKWRC